MGVVCLPVLVPNNQRPVGLRTGVADLIGCSKPVIPQNRSSASVKDANAMLAARKTLAKDVQALGVSEPTYDRWRKDAEGISSSEAKRLKQVETENARLPNRPSTCRS